MRILADYRPALRERTGVGEYVHRLMTTYAAAHPDEVTFFSSSWKDRLEVGVLGGLRAQVIDRRIPVRLLNLAWHRAGWPPVETVAGRFDVVHSFHPLLIPARRAAQVVTIHDLFFLDYPGSTAAEIRRDYPALTRRHAQRADAIVTPSAHVARLVSERLGVGLDRVYVCRPGSPTWRSLGRGPQVRRDGYVLFVGTLEPRKNLGTLLDAYTEILRRRPDVPRLVIAGRATPQATEWLTRIAAPPLRGHVELRGYVSDADRESLYAGARVLVLPSLDEGFGIPALEAMSAGIPVVATNRGALPEVLGDGGMLVDPTSQAEMAAALETVIADDRAAETWARAGLARAQTFTWSTAAATLRRAYLDAVSRRRERPPTP
jgi:glycosyltransferase involved in cell wall biosynthesis